MTIPKPQPIVSMRLSYITRDGRCHSYRPETGLGMGILDTPLTPQQMLTEIYNAAIKLAHLAGDQFQRDLTNLIQSHLLAHYIDGRAR
jgi:hypothetical protein